MNPVAFASISTLLVWLLLSILVQFNNIRWLRIIRGIDVFCLLPAWTFFAPRPGTSDVNLLYRDRLVDGSTTPWRATSFRDPGWIRFLWNPYRRRQKCLFDMYQSLGMFAAEVKSVERIVLHGGYIALLNFVSSLPRNPLHISTQFLLAHTPGALRENEPQILFISAVHRLRE